MSDDELWQTEQRLWTGGVAVYEEWLDADCIMAFPPPAGIMRRKEILQSISRASRWAAVDMTDRKLSRFHPGAAVLAYHARAERNGKVYETVCTSVYLTRSERYRIVQHQQTPWQADQG